MTNLLDEFPDNREERIAELDAARARLLHEVEQARREMHGQTTTGTGWSLAQLVYHLHLGETATTLGLERKLASPERTAPATAGRLRKDWERIRKLIGERHTKVEAPGRVSPHTAPDLDEVLALLAQSRQAFLRVIESAPEKDLLSISLPHPFAAVGELIGISWTSATAFHELRHCEQVREMVSASPRTSAGA